MAITRILHATDFSPEARGALEHAAELSRRLGVPLVLCTAVELPIYPLPEGAMFPRSETMSAMVTSATEGLDAQKRTAEELGAVAVETVVGEGPAAAEIVRIAHERGCDLVVVGSHGRRPIVRALLGSVADRILRTAHCPVLIVPRPERA